MSAPIGSPTALFLNMAWLPSDITFGLRRLRKSPGFTATALLTLALAIGANTTVFSLLNALVLRPLPVERPQELVFLSGGRGNENQSYPNYVDFRSRTKTLAGLAAVRMAVVALSHGGENARIWGYEVSGNYFQLLGVHPAVGRFFTPAEDQRVGGDPYVVLSHSAWQRRFGGDPGIVNKSVKINGLDYTVLGVAPKGFFGTEVLYAPDFWVPISMEPQIEPGNDWLNEHATWDIWVLGRLKHGVSWHTAQSEMQAIAAQLVREHPRENDRMRAYLVRPGLLGDAYRGPVTAFTTVIMGVAGMVLLIACTNLASFLLARSTDRRRETAIRLALGSGRARLIRQFLVENLLLAVCGGAAGLLLAAWLTDLITTARLPFDFPLNTALQIDVRVLLFTGGASIATVLFFGLVPAIQASKPDVLPALKNESWSGKLRRLELRDLLVGGQIALSVVLLAGSVLVVRSLQNALTVNVGFNPRNAASVSFELGLQGYSRERGLAFQRALLEKVQALPGIESASLASTIPLGLDVSYTGMRAYGQPATKVGDLTSAIYYYAGPDFFRTLQTRMLEGRDFTWRDASNAPMVVIINKALADKLFPHGGALGQRVAQGTGGKTDWWQVVGIVENGKYSSLNDENQPAIFRPMLQQYSSESTLVARSRMPGDRLIAVLRKAVSEMDASLPLYDVATLKDHLALPLTPASVAASALGAFGFLAVVLAAVGVYGSMAYAVARRTREIGIRVAIGARRNDVLALVTRRASMIVVIGTISGAALALLASGLFRAVLYGISPRDPATYALAVVLMAAIGVVACIVPARRAMAVDPAIALRDE
jgi:predicted permease